MQAPAVGLRWGRYFAGASLTSGSVTFPLKRGLKLESPQGRISQVSGKADLTQLETGVGYYVVPWFGPYVGYLSQNQEFEFATNESALDAKGKQDLGTVLIGALFNQPTLWPRTAFYANGAFVGVLSGDVRGGLAEVGFAYAALRAPVSFSAGFKYQDLRYQRDSKLILNENPRDRDTFLGLTLGIHYTLD